MLKPQQIPELKNADKTLYNLSRTLIDSINQFALHLGIDPKPASQVDAKKALPSPRAPSSINITVIGNNVFVRLGASADGTDSVFYFVERSLTKTFQEVQQYKLGHALQINVPENPGTTYWRAFCRFQMSGQSPYIYWENQ